MFNGLTEGIPGLTAHATQVTVTIKVGDTSLTRIVDVAYTSSVNTIFAQVLGKSTLPVGGVSEASATAPPNIDFYVLLDNSPSMVLPATTAGITKMQSLTTQEETGGCAFACHHASTNTNSDTKGNPCVDGTTPTLSAPPPSTSKGNSYCTTAHGGQIDNYKLARNNKHHASPGRTEQRHFDPAPDRIDDRQLVGIRNPAEVSFFDLLDGQPVADRAQQADELDLQIISPAGQPPRPISA